MKLRIALCIVAMGLTGCALLQFRQARLQTVHELASAQSRTRKMHDEALRLRADLIRTAADAAGQEPPASPSPPRSAGVDLDEPAI